MKTITYDENLWKLVPVKPTYEMLAAFRDCNIPSGSYAFEDYNDQLDWEHWYDYSAILAAAPQPPKADTKKSGDAHEIWAAAQLAPGEGIEDGVARVEALLGAQRVPMTDDEIRQCRLETEYDGTPSEPLIHRSTHSRFMAFARAVEQFHGIGVKS